MNDNTPKNKGEIVLYQTEDGLTKLNVQLQDESVWLSMDQMAELFQRDKSVISRHLKNVFAEGDLDEKVVVQPDSALSPACAWYTHSEFCGMVEGGSRVIL